MRQRGQLVEARPEFLRGDAFFERERRDDLRELRNVLGSFVGGQVEREERFRRLVKRGGGFGVKSFGVGGRGVLERLRQLRLEGDELRFRRVLRNGEVGRRGGVLRERRRRR